MSIFPLNHLIIQLGWDIDTNRLLDRQPVWSCYLLPFFSCFLALFFFLGLQVLLPFVISSVLLAF